MSKEKYRILTINPGSTSTKIALFENDEKIFQKNVIHSAEELAQFPDIPSQLHYRRDMIIDAVNAEEISMDDIDVFVSRGGGQAPCDGGTYVIEGLLLEHARIGYSGSHAAILGAVIAHEFAAPGGKPAFIVDTPDMDELEPVARISGLKDYPRKSSFHALNQKEVARRAAKEIGKSYDTARLVVGHLGGGISVAVHRYGRAIDADNIIGGSSPMAPTRVGNLAVGSIASLCFSGQYTKDQVFELITKNGGVVDHLGTSDMQEVERRAKDGDAHAALVYDAMIYQIAKSIGGYATVLDGDVDAIALSGGLTYSQYLVDALKKKIGFIAPVFVYPGEFEMEALAHGALRVLRGTEKVRTYPGEIN
jgi:butyrate kinase